MWHDRDKYKHARETLQSLRVVNDQAERGIALIQEYSGLLTKMKHNCSFYCKSLRNTSDYIWIAGNKCHSYENDFDELCLYINDEYRRSKLM